MNSAPIPLLQPFEKGTTDDALWEELCRRVEKRAYLLTIATKSTAKDTSLEEYATAATWFFGRILQETTAKKRTPACQQLLHQMEHPENIGRTSYTWVRATSVLMHTADALAVFRWADDNIDGLYLVQPATQRAPYGELSNLVQRLRDVTSAVPTVLPRPPNRLESATRFAAYGAFAGNLERISPTKESLP